MYHKHSYSSDSRAMLATCPNFHTDSVTDSKPNNVLSERMSTPLFSYADGVISAVLSPGSLPRLID